jgi:hypothetical protein
MISCLADFSEPTRDQLFVELDGFGADAQRGHELILDLGSQLPDIISPSYHRSSKSFRSVASAICSPSPFRLATACFERIQTAPIHHSAARIDGRASDAVA